METKLIFVKTSDDTLQHHGVKGMKWGVRRSASALAKAAQSRKSRRDGRTAKDRAKGMAGLRTEKDTRSPKDRAKDMAKVATAGSVAGKIGMKSQQRSNKSAVPKTSEQKAAERRRNIKVAAGVSAGAVAVLGTVVVAKHYNVPVKKLPSTAMKSAQKAMDKYSQQSLANQRSLESLNRIHKQARAQASSKSAGAAVRGMNRKPTIKNTNSGKALKDLYAKTDRFSKLLEEGKLTPGQSKEWEAVNDAMVEIFKKDNPYM